MDIKAIYQRYIAEQFARLKARIFKDYAVEEIQEYCREAEKGMVNESSERKTKRFLWGTVLTWAQVLSVLFIVAVLHSFRGISEQKKATGLVATAIPPRVEVYAIFGFILAVLVAAAAIVLLIRSFSSGHRMRSLVSLLYIGWNAVMLIGLAGVFTGLVIILHHIHSVP